MASVPALLSNAFLCARLEQLVFSSASVSGPEARAYAPSPPVLSAVHEEQQRTVLYTFSLDGSQPPLPPSATQASNGAVMSSALTRNLFEEALQRRLRETVEALKSKESRLELHEMDLTFEFVMNESELFALTSLASCSSNPPYLPHQSASLEALEMAQSCANLLLYPQQAQQEASQSVSDERVMPAIASRRESACDTSQSAVYNHSLPTLKVKAESAAMLSDSSSTSSSIGDNEATTPSPPIHPTGYIQYEHPLASSLGISLPDLIAIAVPTRFSKMLAKRTYYRCEPYPKRQEKIQQEAAVVTNKDDALEKMQVDVEVNDDAEESSCSSQSVTSVQDCSKERTAVDEVTEEHADSAAVTAQLVVMLQQHLFDPLFFSHIAQSLSQNSRAVCERSVCELHVQLAAGGCAGYALRQLLLSPLLLKSIGGANSSSPVPLSAQQHQYLPDPLVVTGFDGDLRTLPHSAIGFWDQTCLEPFKPTADMLYLVIPAPTTTAIERKAELLPFFQALGGMYETCLLGRHRPLQKCYNDVLMYPDSFRSANARLKEQPSETEAEFAQRYYNFVLQQLGSASMKSKLVSIDTSILVVYMVVDSSFPTSLSLLANTLNRIRVLLGSPTWASASRRKNVITQIIPRKLSTSLLDSRDETLSTTLKEISFSVFFRCHFVPSISLSSTMSMHPQLQNGIGITSFEPSFVVHAETAIPCADVAALDTSTPSSLLSVHICYSIIERYASEGQKQERWLIGASTDMRGERLQSAMVRLSEAPEEQKDEEQVLQHALTAFWSESVRPLLDFLHSRTDQGAMTLVINRINPFLPKEAQCWRSVLSSSLGDTWSRFDASCHETGGQLESLTAMQIDVDVGVDTAMGAFAAEPATSSTEGIDVSFLVSGALLLSCRSGPALQIVRSSQINHELGGDVHDESSISMVAHSLRPLRSMEGEAEAMQTRNLYISDIDDEDNERLTSLELSLLEYLVHVPSSASASSSNPLRIHASLPCAAFEAVVRQTAALKVMGVPNGVQPFAEQLPLHFEAVQRLAFLFAASGVELQTAAETSSGTSAAAPTPLYT